MFDTKWERQGVFWNGKVIAFIHSFIIFAFLLKKIITYNMGCFTTNKLRSSDCLQYISYENQRQVQSAVSG